MTKDLIEIEFKNLITKELKNYFEAFYQSTKSKSTKGEFITL